jgi:hypothetical protein
MTPDSMYKVQDNLGKIAYWQDMAFYRFCKFLAARIRIDDFQSGLAKPDWKSLFPEFPDKGYEIAFFQTFVRYSDKAVELIVS